MFLSSVDFSFDALSHSFLFGDVENAGREGGIASILVSTSLVVVMAVVGSLLLSIFSGYYLSIQREQNIYLYRFIDIFIYILIAVPSIVMGLFGNIIFVKKLGLGYSLLSGSLTLLCMILPLMIKIIEESFSSINSELKNNIKALGFSRWSSFYKIYLPLVKTGIIYSIVIGVGRALCETAALLFTSGYVTRMPENLSDSGRVLSVHIFELVMNIPGGDLMAKKSVTVLFIAVFIFNIVALKLMGQKNYGINH